LFGLKTILAKKQKQEDKDQYKNNKKKLDKKDQLNFFFSLL
jgi:hypothetical protein